MSQPLDFQSIIMTLQDFWAKHDCLIWQPYYSQVGAGTYNPATALRVLGPEPWNVGYVEPSIRPDDGRYGENPNRMQMHYQFQVILKPDPGNPQELYLKSLEALGIDPRKHDIRFVEDNWESPALGAWGLGWEVWLDGQEITQFTYFQQAGGYQLDPVSVEITYGLERIAIALQRVSSFRDIQWSPALTDGDVNLQAEQEHSKYYFEVAGVERLRQMYDLYEAEANACLKLGLVLPAHDYVIKCSHTFNVLDTRGAVGVTERQALFGRMRELSHRVAEAYLEQRQRLEYPLIKDEGETHRSGTASGAATIEAPRWPLPSAVLPARAPLLIEIGTEELPAADLSAAIDHLQSRIPGWLQELRLEYGTIQIFGTPRRLVVYVEDVSPGQPDLESVVKGPPADRAYDASGQPTKAAEGFARSKGVDITDLQVREMDGGRYVAAIVRQAGRPSQAVLTEALPELIASLHFDKSMRWNASNISFSRPLRWLLALFGGAIQSGDASQVIPFTYAGVSSGRMTRGLRYLEPAEFEVLNPADYFRKLAQQGIILDVSERRRVIQEQVQVIAASVKGAIADDPTLLNEVTNLVEAPTALLGSFDASHLNLPREVLISVMKKHQRYFPVISVSSKDGILLPYFITVANKPGNQSQELELVVEGNEHVIRARFADAAFFVREDIKKTLEEYLPRLGTLIFQTKLGSMLDKARRIEALIGDLAQQLGLDADEVEDARRAAHLAKADLATHMVVEMTSLQGTMGRYYALNSGEKQSVAEAIFEHYLPRYTGDQSPRSRPGLAVGLADRLDTLVGLFAVGLAPSGNKDPFAQRRAALGLVQSLLAWEMVKNTVMDFDLNQPLKAAASHLPVAASPESQAAVMEFIIERLRNMLLEQGWRYDIVDSVVTVQGANPTGAARAVRELSGWVNRLDWGSGQALSILPAYSRCVRITRDLKERYPVDPVAFSEPQEAELYQALGQAEASPRPAGSVDGFLNAFVPMIPTISRFFDTVLVMAEDTRLRQNRLGMLQRIAALSNGVADLSKLEGF